MSSTTLMSSVDTQHEDMIVSIATLHDTSFFSWRMNFLTSCPFVLDQHDAQLDYYAKKLATCSSDRTIRIYDVSGNVQTPLAVLQGCVKQV